MKRKWTTIWILALIVTALFGITMSRGGRYDFPKPKQKQYIIQELEKRLKIIDSNLVFDDKVLTITLPGAKGEKGDSGQAGEPGKDGKSGRDGRSIVGPVGRVPLHLWEDTKLKFQLPDDTWGPTVDLLGMSGRQGEKGDGGKDGVNGLDGSNGVDGITPTSGIDYFNGMNGTNGKDGINGIDGYTPQKGVDYFDGKNGRDGRDGKDGEDAVLPLSVTIQVLTDVKLHSNGRLIKTYKQIKVYLE